MLKRRDIRVRDPFIVLDDGKYYLYATSGERTMSYYVSDDLENWEEVGKPFCLFMSDECPISKATPDRTTVYEGKPVVRYGSDAPFVQKLSNGSLFLTWSPYLNGNYVVLGVVSESGDVRGPWKHLDEPIFDGNGGHAMFFTDKDGRKIMCIHAPERDMDERTHLFNMVERNGKIEIIKELPI